MEVYTDLEKKQEPIYPFPNKDTKIFGSFSKQPGNKGCEFFNNAFKKHNINAIYKSFQIDDIVEAFNAAKILNIVGFAVAMPYKHEAYGWVNELDESITDDITQLISVNTVLNINGRLRGFNTDYIGAKKVLELYNPLNLKEVYVIGLGGLADAVHGAARILGIEPHIVYRKKDPNPGNIELLDQLENKLIFNCTPGDYSHLAKNNCYLDGRVGTITGDLLFDVQAKAQFKLYTGIDYES